MDHSITQTGAPGHQQQLESSEDHPKYGESPKRWLILFIFATLNLITDWTCFSLSPLSDLAADTFDEGGGTAWDRLHVPWVVSGFLIGNVLMTIIEPFLLKKSALRGVVVGAAVGALFGSFIKSGLPFLWRNTDNAFRVAFGFFIVGMAQPFFQVTTVTLVANWFTVEDRILATALALNANQIGIGLAFLVGEQIDSSNDLYIYNECFTYATAALLLASWLFFESRPSLPPSRSAEVAWAMQDEDKEWDQRHHDAVMKELREIESATSLDQQEEDDEDEDKGRDRDSGGESGSGNAPYDGMAMYRGQSSDGAHDRGSGGGGGGGGGGDGGDDDVSSTKLLCGSSFCWQETRYLARGYQVLFVNGFVQTLLVFSLGATITNVIAAFIDDVLDSFEKNSFVWQALVGVTFQVAVVIGGASVAAFNDRAHAHMASASILSWASAFFMAMCTACIGAGSMTGLWVCLIFLGVAVGPLKILMADLGVEVIFPDFVENDALFVQQIICNVFSAILISTFDATKNMTATTNLSAFCAVTVMSVIVAAFFTFTFRAKANRLTFDMKDTLLG